MRKPAIVRHRSIESCMAAYLHVPVDEVIAGRGFWDFCDRHGRHRYWTMRRTLRTFSKRGCWGFCQHRQRRIHVWVGAHCLGLEVILLMAHELGHLGGPHLPKTNNEEIASARENFAGMAVELAGKLAPKPGA